MAKTPGKAAAIGGIVGLILINGVGHFYVGKWARGALFLFLGLMLGIGTLGAYGSIAVFFAIFEILLWIVQTVDAYYVASQVLSEGHNRPEPSYLINSWAQSGTNYVGQSNPIGKSLPLNKSKSDSESEGSFHSIKCPKCGYRNNVENSKCWQCGKIMKTQSSSERTFICDRCGVAVSDDDLFCPKCGNKFDEDTDIRPIRQSPPLQSHVMADTKFCRHCGAQIPVDSTFCEHCGKALRLTTAEDIPDTSDVSDTSWRRSDDGKEEKREYVRCSYCGADSAERSLFCAHCGKPIALTQLSASQSRKESQNICPHCGADNPVGLKYCGKCGESIL